MITVKLSDACTLKLYGSVKELPIYLSKKFQAYLLQDAGIGNTIEDVDNHLGKIMTLLGTGKTEDALEEAKNLRYNMFIMLSQVSYKSMALLCLVHSINGEAWDDYSEEGLAELLRRIEMHPVGELERELEHVKKKLIPNADYISQSTSEMI